MATETSTANATKTVGSTWKAGAIGGIAGGLVFGVMMTMMMPEIMAGAIPGMYGFGESPAAGWVLHLFHSVVLGVVFAAIVAAKPDIAASTGKSLGTSVAYGVVLWVVLATFVMPAWVGAMTPMAPPVPNVNPMSLVGHVVYGAVLGAVFPALTEL